MNLQILLGIALLAGSESPPLDSIKLSDLSPREDPMAHLKTCPLETLMDIALRPGVVQSFGGAPYFLRPLVPFERGIGDIEGFTTPEVYASGRLRVSLVEFAPSPDEGTPLERGVGYVDIDGNLVIPPVFATGETFSEDVAAVSFAPDGPYGYIDPGGALVIEPKFEAVGFFSEGIALAAVDGEWGYIDHAGDWVIAPAFEYAAAFAGGSARVFVEEWTSARVARDGTVSRVREARELVLGGHDEPHLWWPRSLRRAVSRGTAQGRRVTGDSCRFAVTDRRGRLVFDAVPFEAFWLAATAR